MKILWGRKKCRGSHLVLSLVSKGPHGLSKQVLLILKMTSEIIASAHLHRLPVLQAVFVLAWKWHKGTSLHLKARYLRDSQLCGQNKHPQVAAAGVVPRNQGQGFRNFEIADLTLLNTDAEQALENCLTGYLGGLEERWALLFTCCLCLRPHWAACDNCS